jgi:hypothetical protein
MLEVWNRQLDDPDYQYDTPLPPPAGSIAHHEQGHADRALKSGLQLYLMRLAEIHESDL